MKTYTWRVTDEVLDGAKLQARMAGVSLPAYLARLVVADAVTMQSPNAVILTASEAPAEITLATISGQIQALHDAVTMQSPMQSMQSPDAVNAVTMQSFDAVMQSPDSTLEDKLAAADMMEADGDERLARSHFQMRRKVQRTLLQQAWADLFPSQNKLIDSTANDMLAAARNESIEVYAAMQVAVENKATSPLSYVRAVINKRASEKLAREAADSAPTTRVIHEHIKTEPSYYWKVEPADVRRDRLDTWRSTYEQGKWQPTGPDREKKLREMYPDGDIPEFGCKAGAA